MDTPAEALDKELKVALRRFHRMRWMLVGVLAVAVALALTVGGTTLADQHSEIIRNNAQLARDNARLLASCDFYRPLTPLPVTVSPATHRPTEIGVSIIAGAREAYLGQGCPGRIPPADPSLLKWAGYYHLPVRG